MSMISSEKLIERYNAGELNVQEFVQQYYQSQEARPRLEKVLSELQDIANWGQQCLRIWRQSYEVMQGDKQELIELAFRYFIFIGAVLIQAAILQAAKLTEANSDSVSLDYFFNILLNEGKKHFPHNWEEVKNAVKSDRAQMQGLHPVLCRIKTERDKEIAHRDRSFVSSSMTRDTYVEVQELEQLFQIVQGILDKYHVYYHGSPPEKITLTEDALAYFGPEGLEDIFNLALQSLDDESIRDASNHVKQVRTWRRTRLLVARDLKARFGGGQ
jgi:hypothetical protein